MQRRSRSEWLELTDNIHHTTVRLQELEGRAHGASASAFLDLHGPGPDDLDAPPERKAAMYLAHRLNSFRNRRRQLEFIMGWPYDLPPCILPWELVANRQAAAAAATATGGE